MTNMEAVIELQQIHGILQDQARFARLRPDGSDKDFQLSYVKDKCDAINKAIDALIITDPVVTENES